MKSEEELLEEVAKLAGTASTIESTELTKDQVKKAWLIPYHWKKGQSGNPRGRRAERKPLTEALEWVMDLPYPPELRVQLENKFGLRLRRDLTFAQAIALGRSLGAVVDTSTADWIATRLEGAVRQAVELSGPGGQPLPPPILVTQYVELAQTGEPTRIIEVQPDKSTNGNRSNGSGGAAPDNNSLPEGVQGS